MHHTLAIEKCQNSPDRRLRTPTIVYERVGNAGVLNDKRVRKLMQHDDVTLRLKRNTFCDYRIVNVPSSFFQHRRRGR